MAVWAVFSAQPTTPILRDPAPMMVELIQLPPPLPIPPPPPAPPSSEPTPEPAPAEPPKRRSVARPTPHPPPEIAPIAAGKDPKPQTGVELSESDIIGATTSASGAGGGTCNMARWLEGQLRKDYRVRAAMADVNRGRPILVWNGSWIIHPGQEGAGLAAVREVLMWEIAFAPEACRSKPVRGLIMLSLNDGPSGARLAFGAGEWRWSDMLFAHGGRPPSTFHR